MANKKWNKIPLKKLCSRIGDGLHGTPEYVFDSEIYFINGNNLKNGRIEITSDTKRVTASELSKNFIPLNENSLLLSINGTLGSMAFYNGEKVMLGKSAAYLNFNSNINQFYYYYFQLKGVQEYFYNVATGSTIKNLSLKSIQDFEVPVPEESDRNGIVRILKSLDAKIELNNKINRELESMAKTLYDYWFVQFDFPDANGKPYKSSGGKMVYNAELKREIPEGWEVGNLKNNSLTDLIKPKIDFFEGEKTYLATADVVNNEINFDADKITFENRESRANMQPIKNSVWFAKMKNSKKVLCVGEYSNYYLLNFILSTGFAGLKCKEKHFVEYIWGFVNNDDFEKIKDRLSNGATQEAINNDSMAYIPLIVPKGNILKKYHKMTIKIFKKIYLNKIENQQLTELRDWLLPMLMNGQVTVKEAEEKLSMAAEPSEKYGN